MKALRVADLPNCAVNTTQFLQISYAVYLLSTKSSWHLYLIPQVALSCSNTILSGHTVCAVYCLRCLLLHFRDNEKQQNLGEPPPVPCTNTSYVCTTKRLAQLYHIISLFHYKHKLQFQLIVRSSSHNRTYPITMGINQLVHPVLEQFLPSSACPIITK